jgi:hypothetical protein
MHAPIISNRFILMLLCGVARQKALFKYVPSMVRTPHWQALSEFAQ